MDRDASAGAIPAGAVRSAPTRPKPIPRRAGLYAAVLLLAALAVRPGSTRAELLVAEGLEGAYGLFVAYDRGAAAGLVGPLDAAGVQVIWFRSGLIGGQPSAFLARGGASILGGTIVVNEQLIGSSDEALAALLAHEGRHAVDLLMNGRPIGPAACAEGEIRAHQEQARAWAFLVGPAGKADPAPGLETDLNDVLLAAQAGPEAIQEWTKARGLNRC
jgi:hypothetical protein